MDALSSNIRVSSAEPVSSPDKRSIPESQPTAGTGAGAPSALVVVATKTEDILRKPPTDDSKPRDTPKDIEGAVIGANRFFEQISRELRFERSETEGKIVVQVRDQKTGEVIRQFPSEEMLQISKDMERISGLLFKDSA
jgi:flagellar protein FlaG